MKRILHLFLLSQLVTLTIYTVHIAAQEVFKAQSPEYKVGIIG